MHTQTTGTAIGAAPAVDAVEVGAAAGARTHPIRPRSPAPTRSANRVAPARVVREARVVAVPAVVVRAVTAPEVPARGVTVREATARTIPGSTSTARMGPTDHRRARPAITDPRPRPAITDPRSRPDPTVRVGVRAGGEAGRTVTEVGPVVRATAVANGVAAPSAVTSGQRSCCCWPTSRCTVTN